MFDAGPIILCVLVFLCVVGSAFVMLITRPISNGQKTFFRNSVVLFALLCLFNYKVFYLDEGLTGLTELKDTPEALRRLRLGANPNASFESGPTVLIRAIHNNNPELVKALISKGANVNETCRDVFDGMNMVTITPMKAALKMKNPRIIQMLREAGARP